jgi:hypothetical protein
MSFYNTAPPTSSSKNNITDIAVSYGIRDFLLNKNLLPVYPMALNNSPGTVRIGEPILDTMVGTGNVVVPFGLPLETNGILRMEIAVLPNQFKNTSSTANDLQTIDYLPKLSNTNYPNTDFPQGIESYPTKPTTTIEQYGIQAKTVEAGWRKNANLLNLYLDVDGQVDAAAWFDQKPAPISQQVKGYLDTYGGLNLGGSAAIQASSIIGSVLNGQGLGLAKGGVVTNYDIRSSLAGRVLGATGLINDTKLGMIGGQQLALALANNAAFNVQQAALGALNVRDNVLSLVKNGTLAGFRPNYQITVPSGDLGKVADYTAKILGFTLPKSYLQDSGSIFLSESNSANIERANSMILNTGKGQVAALISNINANLIGTGQFDNPDTTPFRSGYAPGYKDNRGQESINPNLYAFYNSDKATIYNFLVQTKGIIPEINYNRSGMVKEYGFTSPEETVGVVNPYEVTTTNSPNLKGDGFTWGSSVGGTVNSENSPFGGNIVTQYPMSDSQTGESKKKNLLAKTQMLFDDLGMKNIVSGFGDINPSIKASQINTTNGGGISKGSAVLSGNKYDENGYYTGELDSPVNTYCRTWTTKLRYDSVTNLIRSKGLDTTVPYRFQTQNSSLDQYGFAKIAPYITDSQKVGDPKNFMFSIENLAWNENFINLLPVEQGPGDLTTGKRGRIMWFPPYNIQFSENSAVSWEANNFIGRGEPVYTYNNTERSGQLSFSIIVDHPSYSNSFRDSKGPDDNYVASFFAGCVEPSQKFADKLTVAELSDLSTKNITKPQIVTVTPELPPPSFSVYFPNDNNSLSGAPDYENGKCGATPIDYTIYLSGCGIGIYPGTFTSSGKTSWNDGTNYGLNGQKNIIEIDGVKYSGISDSLLIPALNEYLVTKCPHCVVEVAGYASVQGNSAVNQKLADARATSIINTLSSQLFIGLGLTDDERKKRFKKLKSEEIKNSSCVKDGPTDTQACKVDRKATINFRFDESLLSNSIVDAAPVQPQAQESISSKIKNRFYNEGVYFEQLTDIDSFVFDRFRDKIRYFHPAFHSTTPEGLNSRLTFLQQCTRQGPTTNSIDANNLAFGRPPVCILRIGDFYNTKIVIDSVAIDYEPLVWDLNPEGVGIQPMIANVNLSFKFIGGSSLMGPINKLQNALSFNYYANTHVYDPRADYIAKDEHSQYFKDKVKEGATEDFDSYSIANDGASYPKETREEPQSTIDVVTPTVDQSKLNEKVNSGTPPSNQTNTPTNAEDISRIKLKRIDSLGGGIEITFEIEGNSSLNKEYYVKFILTDNNNLTTELGIDKFNVSDLIQTFYQSLGENVNLLVDGNTYFIKVVIDSVNIIRPFTYTK